MNITDMWKGVITLKVLMIFIGFMIFSTGATPLWIAVGLIMLLGGCFLSFRQGQGAGHEACGVSKSISHVQENGGQLDPKLCRGAWNVANGVKAIFAGAVIGYVVNAVYIICTLVGAEESVVLSTRMASFVVSIPYMPIVGFWHENYVALTPDLVAVFMIGPFLLPLCQFLGYLQGPKLWEKTEKAMAEGKRRAKARSRIVKKKNPRLQKPEI